MPKYNKLVRDKIPDIIKENNEEPIIRILDKIEYKQELDAKLKEEVNEYLESDEVLELADILEVIYAIIDYKEISIEYLEKICKEKKAKRGGFNKQIYLLGVEEKRN